MRKAREGRRRRWRDRRGCILRYPRNQSGLLYSPPLRVCIRIRMEQEREEEEQEVEGSNIRQASQESERLSIPSHHPPIILIRLLIPPTRRNNKISRPTHHFRKSLPKLKLPARHSPFHRRFRRRTIEIQEERKS